MYSVYLAEDEPLALESLAHMFKSQTRWKIIGQADNGAKALSDCLLSPPDLLITDIRMPILNGLELVTELSQSDNFPQVVFITAYDQHAVDAFKLAAVDYLLKPITDQDFAKTLHRVETFLKHQQASSQVTQLKQSLCQLMGQKITYRTTLVIRSIGRVDFIDISDVIALCACGNYVDVITKDNNLLHRQTLKSLEAELDPDKFIRIHRSSIVAQSQIKSVTRLKKNYHVLLNNGLELPIGAIYEKNLFKTLKDQT